MFLKKTNFEFPVNELKHLLENIDWDDKNRCALNYKTGNWLYDEYKIKDCWKNTKFEELLDTIPYEIGEARLIKLEPGLCYRSHADVDDRLHLNIQSNPYSFLADLDNGIMHRLCEDNFLYYMDGSYKHTAANFGSTSRIQLVIRVRLKRHQLKNSRQVDLEFSNPPSNLRYLLDQSISPLLNIMCKQGQVGYFDVLAHNKIRLFIESRSFNLITEKLIEENIEYNVININERS